MDILIPPGLAWVQFIQQLSPMLDGMMKAVSFLGSFEFYILIIPLIYYAFDRALGLRMLFILVSTDVLGNFLKQLFHQPRPYWVSTEVKALSSEISYGMPSTHASNTLAVYGIFACSVRKAWVWVLTVILLLLVGVSRLYLGVHFPQDVFFGWLIGLVVLLVFLRGEARFLAWWKTLSLNAQIGIGFIFSLLIILMGLLVRWLISGSPDPTAWSSYAAGARALTTFFNDGGALFGGITGAVLMQRYASFRVEGAWWVRMVRYALGLVGVFAFYLGLDVLFALIAADDSVLGLILRYVRYGTVTFWAIFLAPWLFLKLKLVKA